jgi:hypothetical protein
VTYCYHTEHATTITPLGWLVVSDIHLPLHQNIGHPLVTATGTKSYDLEDLNSLGFNMTESEIAKLMAIRAGSCWT